jgi:phosphatidylinositol alpha-1,6-mannosyltransferase
MAQRRHLLVTNDFPPKVGGIQSYLWELWRRLDPESFRVLTARSDPGADSFDQEQRERGIQIERVSGSTLYLPTARTLRAVEHAIDGFDPDLVVIDPAFPLGSLVTKLTIPTALILHGAEVTIPGRVPLAHRSIRRALRVTDGVIAAGPYPRAEAERIVGGFTSPVLEIPPGVDTSRFRPVDPAQRAALRARLGVDAGALLVTSVSRLVPRKGMDTLVKAAKRLQAELPAIHVLIGGTGRDEKRLASLVRRERAPATLLGRVPDDELPELVGASDLFVMDCRSRWAGLEQEGFGIVFLEAAAAGVAQIAGQSGGAADAVVEDETGLVVEDPRSVDELARAMGELLRDPDRRVAMGRAARARAVASFDYDVLARRLGDALDDGWPTNPLG